MTRINEKKTTAEWNDHVNHELDSTGASVGVRAHRGRLRRQKGRRLVCA